MVDAAKVLRLNDSLLQLNEQGTIDFCKNVQSLFGNNFLKHVLFLGLWKIAQNQMIDVANFKSLIQETQLRTYDEPNLTFAIVFNFYQNVGIVYFNFTIILQQTAIGQ